MKYIQSHKKLLLKIILYVMGIIMMPLGVVFTINSHMGAGGYDALNFILGERIGVSTSYAIIGTAFIAMIISALIRKKIPRITTFITAILVGITTQLWKGVLSNTRSASLFLSITFLFIGITIIGFGIASYMLSELPTNPTDDIIVACKERGLPIRNVKIGMDIICVLLALILGGEIGIGTIFITICLGPMVSFFYDFIKKKTNDCT